jgi:hypothetical protein
MAIATNAGFVELAKHATGTGSPVAWTYMALGEGTGQSASSTTLNDENTDSNGLQRTATGVTASTVTTTVTGDTAQWVKTFTSTATMTITEAGIFNASSGGDMLVYGELSPTAPMVSTDTLTLTIKCQFKAAS